MDGRRLALVVHSYFLSFIHSFFPSLGKKDGRGSGRTASLTDRFYPILPYHYCSYYSCC